MFTPMTHRSLAYFTVLFIAVVFSGCVTQKDKAMAAEADYGFVLWDGKSSGSISNVFELLMPEISELLINFALYQVVHGCRYANAARLGEFLKPRG